jgi:hypothetical protein
MGIYRRIDVELDTRFHLPVPSPLEFLAKERAIALRGEVFSPISNNFSSSKQFI